jgi:DNA polymerase-3 subunit delta
VTPQELTKRLTSGRIEPLYLVLGEEPWLVDQALGALRRYAAATDDLMNTHIFSGAEVTGSEIVAMAQTFPALAPRRFIVVRDAERLAAADALTAYCADPSPSTCLVFVMPKPDRRKAWVQALTNRAATVTCDPLKPFALGRRLQREATSREITLTEEGAACLLARSDWQPARPGPGPRKGRVKPTRLAELPRDRGPRRAVARRRVRVRV